MKEHFIQLFNYDYWATQQLIEALEKGSNYDTKCSALLSHIIEAQIIWLERLRKNDAYKVATVWPIYSIDESKIHLDDILLKGYNSFITALSDASFLNEVVYTNTKGQSFSSSVKDILTHVVNHGTHHRAQIISLLKQSGNEYPIIDYIFYLRK